VRPADRIVTTVHLAFDVMVGTGLALLALAAWFGFLWVRRREVPTYRLFLRCASLGGVVSVIALESGWVVTEVGRQPWTVVGLLQTDQAVTRSGQVWVFFTATLLIYLAVGTATVVILRAMARRWRSSGGRDIVDVPYGPSTPSPGWSSAGPKASA
jgi:cytochrome d ubiquinol oxidase subunit I